MSIQETISQHLDSGQLRAVLSDSRHILAAAAPGSGKTRVLAYRFARLLEKGVPPSDILAVTFTNRAAREMKERIASLASIEPKELNVGTFHGFCLKLLKKELPAFTLSGRDESEYLLKELGFKDAGKLLDRISSYKNGCGGLDENISEAFSAYEKALKERSALDLDDLMVKALEVLERKNENLFSHVMVDEFQDINPVQGSIIAALAHDCVSLLAIGDPDQAIYAFRGSNVKSFLDFEKDYPDAEVVTLAKNYRSSGKIVAASQKLIENNKERFNKNSIAIRHGGGIELIECGDERAEAEFIIKEIERMMGGLSSLTVKDSDDARFSDFAVLYRTNRQAEALADAFERSPLPFNVITPPGAGFGDFIRRLKNLTLKDTPLSELVRAEGKCAGLDENLLDIFLSVAEGFEGTMAEYIEEMVLSKPVDNYDVKADKVSLMTLHASKGLEFRTVFITGVEDGLIPFSFPERETDIEEERRLFYVGLTRAKETLYLLTSKKRKIWGEAREMKPSPFLRELPDKLVSKRGFEKKPVKKRAVQKGLFD